MPSFPLRNLLFPSAVSQSDRYNARRMRIPALLLAYLSLLGLVACGSGGSSNSGASLSLSFSPASALVFSGQPSATVNVTLTRQGATGNVTLSVQGLPTGAAATNQSPGTSNSGSITLSAASAASATYPLTVTASDGTLSGSAALSLVVGAVAQIG